MWGSKGSEQTGQMCVLASLFFGAMSRQARPISLSCHCCCCSVAKSCPTLCDPMDYSMPGSPVLYHLPEFAQIMSTESAILSNHLIFCHPLLLLPSIFPKIRERSFPMSWLFVSGDQSIGASPSSSYLPMNIQD